MSVSTAINPGEHSRGRFGQGQHGHVQGGPVGMIGSEQRVARAVEEFGCGEEADGGGQRHAGMSDRDVEALRDSAGGRWPESRRPGSDGSRPCGNRARASLRPRPGPRPWPGGRRPTRPPSPSGSAPAKSVPATMRPSAVCRTWRPGVITSPLQQLGCGLRVRRAGPAGAVILMAMPTESRSCCAAAPGRHHDLVGMDDAVVGHDADHAASPPPPAT